MTTTAQQLQSALDLLDECASALAYSGCCSEDAIAGMAAAEALSDRVTMYLEDADYDSNPDPCPTCHARLCPGCLPGYGASLVERDAAVRLERWLARKAANPLTQR